LTESSWPGQQAFTESCSFLVEQEWIPENCNIVVEVFENADSLYKSPVMQAIKVSVAAESAISEGQHVNQEITGVFPNPSSDISNIHISIADKGFCTLNVYDLHGKQVRNMLQGVIAPGLYNIEIQTRTIPKGVYLLVLETSKGRSSEKLIIK